MPEMSGQEFCVELRKTVPDAVVPVIMISAKTDEENIVNGLSHGCNDFIWCVNVCKLSCSADNVLLLIFLVSHVPIVDNTCAWEVPPVIAAV